MRHETGLQSFVRGLLAGGEASRTGEAYALPDGQSAEADTVVGLLAEGVLSGGASHCRANSETRAWLKRSLLDADAFAAQHRVVVTRVSGESVNLIESPLGRLAVGRASFLEPYHLETGERVRRLVERAQLQPRLTMTYSASRVAGGPQHKNDISDLAADARRKLAEIHERLPPECASVVLDVCGFLKGLQEIERERGWPRRSAKLVLRIGLEQLAQYFGIAPLAAGSRRAQSRQWMDDGARPTRFG
jgi:hypothetical protein